MKIAIQGHSTRGKEVIQILESLDGVNRMNHKGCYDEYFYYISIDNNTIVWTSVRPIHLSVFTLEEFEMQFPFKIGDKVITPDHKSYKIIALENYNNKICYKLNNGLHYVPQVLKPYKKMKEERNITLTLDKAKEWYKKGGELKEIALQAFSEKELNPLPRSWEEFCTNYPIQDGEAIIDEQTSQIRTYKGVVARCLPFDKNICPSKKSAETHLAMIQLEQLRDCWRQGWVPDYTKTYKKFRIKKLGTEYVVDWSTGLSDFLVFQTEELAKEFLECFRDLIKKAGDLI